MFCACGCGTVTPVYKNTRPHLGHVAGEHQRWINGHHLAGRKRPAEVVTKIVAARIASGGWKQSPEVTARIAAKLRGRKKGPPSAETRRKISEAQKGKKIADSTRQIWSQQRKGRKLSAETRAKLSAVRRGRSTAAWAHKVGAAQRGKPKPFRGEKHYNWKGGASQEDRGPDGYAWSLAVKRRDNYTCQQCGKCGPKADMHAHHIWSFSEFTAKRYDVDNGVTLCRSCHYSKGTHRTPVHLRDLFFGVEPTKPNTV